MLIHQVVYSCSGIPLVTCHSKGRVSTCPPCTRQCHSATLLYVTVCLLYFVPAGLYTAYNNLSFVNLQHFDPTTYFLLLQFRVVVTGIIFQVSLLTPVCTCTYLSGHSYLSG